MNIDYVVEIIRNQFKLGNMKIFHGILIEVSTYLHMNAEEFKVTLKKSVKGQLGFRINLNGNILDIRSGVRQIMMAIFR